MAVEEQQAAADLQAQVSSGLLGFMAAGCDSQASQTQPLEPLEPDAIMGLPEPEPDEVPLPEEAVVAAAAQAAVDAAAAAAAANAVANPACSAHRTWSTLARILGRSPAIRRASWTSPVPCSLPT